FDVQPEDLPEIPKCERRDWWELVRFMKGVYGKVFTDPPTRAERPREFLERYFRFRWHRQRSPRHSEGNQP
ncbi:MAG: hypothetical protein JXQ29_07530, partial [Planctomycetes bacterium]|nr:hypothetical protein [Planctomycetota bacterium]